MGSEPRVVLQPRAAMGIVKWEKAVQFIFSLKAFLFFCFGCVSSSLGSACCASLLSARESGRCHMTFEVRKRNEAHPI